MLYHVNHMRDGTIVLQFRAEGKRVVGDGAEFLSPGEEFMGHTYDEIKALGPGAHDIEEKPQTGG